MEGATLGSTLIIGPAYSGKSDYASRLLIPELQTLVIGTSLPLDAVMESRIKSLKLSRPKHWQQLDLKLGLVDQIEDSIKDYAQVLVDSFSQYLAQEILVALEAHSFEQVRQIIEAEVARLIQLMKLNSKSILIVSSEVGAGPSPMGETSRLYRELLGRSHCRIAAAARHVIRLDAGIAQLIKSQG